MDSYYIRKVLDEDQLKIINDIILNANLNNYWMDGLKSMDRGGNHKIKQNQELSDADLTNSISNIIMKSLDLDKKFIDFCAAQSTTTPIISKMIPGNYYHPHIDNWITGDYSTTLFLSHPKEYDGGELCLDLGGEHEHMFKLNPGWAITYLTGSIHRVNRVLSGTRYVAVLWTKSIIQNSFIRSIYSEISRLENIANLDRDSDTIKNCKDAKNDLGFCLDSLRMLILREYGQTYFKGN